jgi:hypothetical protein
VDPQALARVAAGPGEHGPASEAGAARPPSRLPLSALIERLARDRPLLIYLDACRNKPLPASVTGEARADGLAEIAVADNVFVAFATMPGMIAAADAGTTGSPQLSPFTQALVMFIERCARPGRSTSPHCRAR